MTKLWGPLGWMTLHSISAIYPENPTTEEKLLLTNFLEAFRETISCPSCKGHFTRMFTMYKSIHPEWNSSRFDLFLFICRAHNTVNKRLDKPIIATVKDCIETLKNNTKINSGTVYRNSYMNYLANNWRREGSSDAFIMGSQVKKMQKINEEYFNPRDTGFSNLTFDRDASVVEFIPEDTRQYRAMANVPDPVAYRDIKIGFQGGRLKLGRR